jgi:hypothetical protein
MPLLFWHDLAPNHGVLALHEALVGPRPLLELHVVVDSELGEASAWWEDQAGRFCWLAEVGKA